MNERPVIRGIDAVRRGWQLRHLPAMAWLLLVLALGWQQWQFWQAPRIDTDVLALLPQARPDATTQAAHESLARSATRQVVVLLGGDDWPRLRAAAQAYSEALRDGPLRVIESESGAAEALERLAPFRRGLLTSEQRQGLRSTPPERLAEAALARLYGPGISGGIGAWREDPLGLWPDWWQARLGAGTQLREGWPVLSDGDRLWVVLPMESAASAFQLDGERPLMDALQRAERAARAAAGRSLHILGGGVPLHAEAAAVRANREVATIGIGSLLAIWLLAWLLFGSLRPLLLVALSLAIGTAAGLAVTSLVFGEVHLLALVFGSTLLGVAVDYGFHYLARRHSGVAEDASEAMRKLRPALMLALGSTLIGYLAIGVAPFPGLRQMALFSMSGLTAAFLTVLLWFPLLAPAPQPPRTLAKRIGASLAAWPRWRLRSRFGAAAAFVLALYLAGGLLQLRSEDGLRSLQSSPAELWQQEREIGRLLGLPSPAQYFVVSGRDVESLLQREEALVQALQPLLGDGSLQGYRAVSDWFPSQARQRADTALVEAAEAAVLSRVSALMQEALPATRGDSADRLLHPDVQAPWAQSLRPLWLGQVDGSQHSVVMLSGLGAASDLTRLAVIGETLDGVRWVDRSAEISGLMAHHRRLMSSLLLLGGGLVVAALWLCFRRHAWRAFLPMVLASGFSMATLGWLGEPFHLFNVLAQMLLLGVGIDYGIFMLAHHDEPSTWLAVTMGAISTGLGFGLLAFSATPALHGFGLSVSFGILAVWLLAPCFRPVSTPDNASLFHRPFH